MAEKSKGKKGFTTIDIVLMAIIAIVSGVATTYINILNLVLTSIGGPILTSTIMGIHSVSGLLIAYIVRKRGAALFTLTLSGIIQILTGNPNGIMAVISTASNGLGAEIALSLFPYKKRWGWTSMIVAGAAVMPIWYIIASFYFGYFSWGWTILIIAFLVRLVSGMVFTGGLSKIIGDILVKTKILNGFKIAEDYKRMKKA